MSQKNEVNIIRSPPKSIAQYGRVQNYGATSSNAADRIITTAEQEQNAGDGGDPSANIETNSSSSNSGSSTTDHMKSTLTFIQKFGFGLGHVYNDLCAGVWFSYTLLFLQGALLMPAPEAGALVMLGQVCDALATPVVGILADRYGTKRKWHVFGTAMVFISFPLIFSLCPWCKVMKDHNWWMPTYFAMCIVTFQFAWAIVQITHLAMIPEMSRTNKDRSDLTATRYSASVCSNVIVFIITWAVLKGRTNISHNNIGPGDVFRFRDISLILTLIGVSMSVLFQFSLTVSGYEQRRILSLAAGQMTRTEQQRRQQETVRRSVDRDESHEPLVTTLPINEVDSYHSDDSETYRYSDEGTPLNRNSANKYRNYKNFLKSPTLYLSALLYVFSRLFMTTSLVYIPLWLDERSWTPQSNISDSGAMLQSDNSQDHGNIEHIATVPLVSFLASFIAAMLLKHTSRFCSIEAAYMIGSIISILGCILVYLFAIWTTVDVMIKLFGIAILFGSGSSITMVSSLCVTANMIGDHTYQGGFIYSAVTFADKLITGIAIVIIENLKCKERSECPEYYRNILAYACGAASCLGLITLIAGNLTRRFQERRRRTRSRRRP